MSDDPIGLCLAGAISPEVAVARLLLGGADAAAIGAMLAARPECGARAAALAGLLEGRGAALDRLAAGLAADGHDHAAEGAAIGRIAGFFDRAVTASPEAAVALYSLGDPAILAAATAEVVDWLAAAGLLRPGMDVLDLGCGIGRMALALAPGCRSVLGIDVSPGMVAEARRRGEGVPGVRFAMTDGAGLDGLEAAGFDLVLAVDSFPYLVQAGPELVARHVAGAARVLRPGGALAVLNWSYRGDLAADRREAARMAAANGLVAEPAPPLPGIWDGTGFVLRRPGGANTHPVAHRRSVARLRG